MMSWIIELCISVRVGSGHSLDWQHLHISATISNTTSVRCQSRQPIGGFVVFSQAQAMETATGSQRSIVSQIENAHGATAEKK